MCGNWQLSDEFQFGAGVHGPLDDLAHNDSMFFLNQTGIEVSSPFRKRKDKMNSGDYGSEFEYDSELEKKRLVPNILTDSRDTVL